MSWGQFFFASAMTALEYGVRSKLASRSSGGRGGITVEVTYTLITDDPEVEEFDYDELSPHEQMVLFSLYMDSALTLYTDGKGPAMACFKCVFDKFEDAMWPMPEDLEYEARQYLENKKTLADCVAELVDEYYEEEEDIPGFVMYVLDEYISGDYLPDFMDNAIDGYMNHENDLAYYVDLITDACINEGMVLPPSIDYFFMTWEEGKDRLPAWLKKRAGVFPGI